jgi:hypothetical protein
MSPSNLMTEEEAIQRHLTFVPSASRNQPFSGFVAALRDARQATKRDPDSGAKIPTANHGSWLGAMGYMALLDQIGSCFKPREESVQQGNTIRTALKYFSNLSDDEIDALYALRCAFAHDYSLYNIPSNRRRSLQHQFAVGVGAGPIVSFPKMPWDGDYNNKTAENETVINLEAFGDLVEYQSIERLWS